MPDADQKEGDEEGEDHEEGLECLRRKAAHQPDQQRVVDVALEPLRKSDVPAAPEIHEVVGGEGPVEVFRDAHAQELAHADHDVGVSGEVAVEIERVGGGDGDAVEDAGPERLGGREGGDGMLLE